MPAIPSGLGDKSSAAADKLAGVDRYRAGSFSADGKGRELNHLSIEQLVAWLGNQLKNTDADIRARMVTISGARDHQADFHRFIEAMTTMKAQDAGGGNCKVSAPLDDPEAFKKTDFYNSLSGEAKNAVDNLISKCWGLKGPVGDVKMTMYDPPKELVQSTIDALTQESSALQSRAEIDTIELQSRLAGRSQLITLVSNMIASAHETAKQILAKGV